MLPAALEVADEIVRDVRTPPNATEAGRALGLEDVCITLPVSPFLKGREGADRCLYVAPTGYWQVRLSLAPHAALPIHSAILTSVLVSGLHALLCRSHARAILSWRRATPQR